MQTKQITLQLFGFILFCLAYALINQNLLVHTVLYRAAANDLTTAAISFLSLSLQALILLACIVFLSRKPFFLVCIVLTISALVNAVYGQILNDTIDVAKISWMLVEARQASNAAGEFFIPALNAAIKMVAALVLLVGARKLIRPPLHALYLTQSKNISRHSAICLFAFILPSIAFNTTGLSPLASERNVYSFLFEIMTADPPPDRQSVKALPSPDRKMRKIIWLVDESISYSIFKELIKPDLKGLGAIDFGQSASLGHCSGPSNFALRAGVNVRNIDEQKDLRSMPSIWGYAKKAGYETTLIDGQTAGLPQNIMLPSERKLIDHYVSANTGMKTDFNIARQLNSMLNTDKNQFVYVVLRGVHFQYQDHFPQGTLPKSRSTMQEYAAAVRYSKDQFFNELFRGLDRDQIAVFYTSDHGQNIRRGTTPHCSKTPVKAEFAIPLIGFFPRSQLQNFGADVVQGHSASQIFPTTLGFMGYSREYARKNYDNDLSQKTAQYVWFGRNVVPINQGDKINLHREKGFPGK